MKKWYSSSYWLLFVCLMPCVKKGSLKARLQRPKGTSHFGHPVELVQGENDSEGSEYSDSEDQMIPDSDDKGTLEAVKAMQTLYSVFLPPHLHSKVMPNKIVSCQII